MSEPAIFEDWPRIQRRPDAFYITIKMARLQHGGCAPPESVLETWQGDVPRAGVRDPTPEEAAAGVLAVLELPLPVNCPPVSGIIESISGPVEPDEAIPPEPPVSAVEVLEYLLAHGAWYSSCIELDGGDFDGEELETIARAAVAQARGDAT